MIDALVVVPRNAMEVIERELNRDPRLVSEHSRRAYRSDLEGFDNWRNSRPFTKLLVEEYAKGLQQTGHTPSSINRALAAIRWWARRLGDLAAEDPALSKDHREIVLAQSARVAAVKGLKGEHLLKGRNVSFDELVALMRACSKDRSPAGARDAALIAIGWATGARRFEIAHLALADIKINTDSSADVSIRGKGSKIRKAYIYGGAYLAFLDWLWVRGKDKGALFYAIRKNGKIAYGHGLSTEALSKILNKRQREATIDPLTWHDFRRTFAGNLLSEGVDLVTIQKLMGHSSPVTTGGYDRRDETVRRNAAKLLNVPYKKRARQE